MIIGGHEENNQRCCLRMGIECPFKHFSHKRVLVGLLLEKQHLNKMHNVKEAYNTHDSGIEFECRVFFKLRGAHISFSNGVGR